MAVAFLGVTRIAGANWSGSTYTPPANTDFIVVKTGAYPGNVGACSGVTFKGTALSNKRQDTILGEARTESWVIHGGAVDLSSGGTLVLTPASGSPTSEEVAFVLAFSGAEQSTTVHATAGIAAATGSGGTEGTSIASVADGMVVAVITSFSTTNITATSPGTERDELQNTSNLMDSEVQTSPGTGSSVSVAWAGMNNASDRAASIISIAPAAADETLACDAGSFAASGQTATAKIAAPAAGGSFAEAGQAETGKIAHPGGAGAFALGGQAAALLGTFSIAGDTGVFVLSGQPAGTAVGTPAANGSFTFEGQAALFALASPSAAGSFALTGSAAVLSIACAVDFGAFVLSGGEAAIEPSGSSSLPCDAGTFVLAGQIMSGALAGPAADGAFALSGQPASPAVGFVSAVGTITLSGGAALVLVSSQADAGLFVLAGNDADVSAGIVEPGVGLPPLVKGTWRPRLVGARARAHEGTWRPRS